VGQYGIKAQYGTGAGDTHDHLPVFRTAGGELEVTVANEIEAAGFLALYEERCLGRKRDRTGGKF
jgi:hypothetical protein